MCKITSTFRSLKTVVSNRRATAGTGPGGICYRTAQKERKNFYLKVKYIYEAHDSHWFSVVVFINIVNAYT